MRNTSETAAAVKKTSAAKKAVRVILIALLAVVAAALLIATHNWKEDVAYYDTANPYITEYGKTMVSAHRSGGGIFPENTMMAFEGCLKSETFKTDIFEFDLHITKDGRLIILHDDTLDRTTDSEEIFGVKKARPENYTLEELKRLNFGEGFKTDAGETPYKGLHGEEVPDTLRASTLEDVLDYIEAAGQFHYIIEIKNKGDLGYQAADALYQILKDRNLLDRTIIGTFNGDVTGYLDETYPDLPRSASIKEVVDFYFASILGVDQKPDAFRFDALQIPANQFVIKLGTNKLVNYAHKYDLAVQYWTINDAETIRMLQSLGADCIMSDVPDVAYSVIHENDAP